MSKRVLERMEIVCETCGVIGEVYRPRRAAPPRLCDCPAPVRVAPSTRPRLCVHCSARLNRYNPGPACGPCAHDRSPGLR